MTRAEARKNIYDILCRCYETHYGDKCGDFRRVLANEIDTYWLKDYGSRFEFKMFSDGGCYFGGISNGKRDDHGAYLFNDGTLWVGQWRDQPNSYDFIKINSEMIYIGEITNGNVDNGIIHYFKTGWFGSLREEFV